MYISENWARSWVKSEWKSRTESADPSMRRRCGFSRCVVDRGSFAVPYRARLMPTKPATTTRSESFSVGFTFGLALFVTGGHTRCEYFIPCSLAENIYFYGTCSPEPCTYGSFPAFIHRIARTWTALAYHTLFRSANVFLVGYSLCHIELVDCQPDWWEMVIENGWGSVAYCSREFQRSLVWLADVSDLSRSFELLNWILKSNFILFKLIMIHLNRT